MTVKVHLGKTATGTFQIDFSESVEPFGTNARKIVMDVLRNFDASIDDLAKWKVTRRSNAIILNGNLTTSTMRRLFSLLEIPSTKFSTLKGQKPAPNDKSAMAKSSQAYYRSVKTLVDDLRKSIKSDAQKRRAYGVWYERYARKMDTLPILNVDDDLLKWGAAVSTTLRVMANAQRSSLSRAGARKSAVYGAYNYSYNNYGYYNARSSGSQRSQITAQERSKANATRFAGWKGIDDSILPIRQKMTKKYGVPF